MTILRTPIIDSHHHFWDPGDGDYPWMTGDLEVLSKPYGPSDLAPLLDATGVTATIAVQARQVLEETTFLLGTAVETMWIAGVVGWVDLTASGVSDTIAELREGPGGDKLVGLRHLVHDEADPEWLLRDEVLRGLSAVADAGLVYDLLVRVRELSSAVEVARRLPNLRLVLDHIAKPPIAAREMEPWSTAISEIARFPNVTCKISGLVTEADWTSWRPTDLAPYVGRAVDLFGPGRLMFGSDWPVCTLAATYSQVFDAVDELLSGLGDDDIGAIFGSTASATYLHAT